MPSVQTERLPQSQKNLASTTTNLLRAVRFVVMYFMRHVMGPETNSNCFISDCFDRENKHEIAFFDPNNISFTFALLIWDNLVGVFLPFTSPIFRGLQVGAHSPKTRFKVGSIAPSCVWKGLPILEYLYDCKLGNF